MDSSSTVNPPTTSKPAQEDEVMVIDDNSEAPANAPIEPEEQPLAGKSGEAVAKMRKSLDKSRKTDNDVIKSLGFKQEAQMLKLKLQKLKGKQTSVKTCKIRIFHCF